MKLCVGAVSRRVVEEAADLDVHQIVASRRQVDVGGGYTGLDQESLVKEVRDRSFVTRIVRDHGGPNQGPNEDDGLDSLRADVAAGFDAVHLDVCKVDRDLQEETLLALVDAVGDTPYELGGEHEEQHWNDRLLRAVKRADRRLPAYVVVDTGAHIWADRQCGLLRDSRYPTLVVTKHEAERRGIRTKAHNFDWVGGRERYARVVDAYNLAPEIAQVEIDAWLAVLSPEASRNLLTIAYRSKQWRRWFNEAKNEGTWFERARCAVRYVLEAPEVKDVLATASYGQEGWVRARIRDAINKEMMLDVPLPR